MVQNIAILTMADQ